MNNQDYLKSISAEFFSNQKKGIFDPIHKNEIRNRYKKAFHKDLKGCSNCYIDAFFQLLNLKSTNMGQFRIKKGIQLVVHSDISKTLNWKTQNDELCMFHLKRDPSVARFFDIIPDGFLESLKPTKKSKEVKEEKEEVINLSDNVTEITEGGEEKSKEVKEEKRGRKPKA